MSSQISQILSNIKATGISFPGSDTKLFSETDTLKYKLTLGFLVVVIIALVYFKREEVSKAFASLVNIDSVVNNVWLNTHLTSAGELASTYVPPDFSLTPPDLASVGLPSVDLASVGLPSVGLP